MKVYLLKLVIFLAMISFLQCCSKSNNKQNNGTLPSSVTINGKIIEFRLKDFGYNDVKIGSDIFGNWTMSGMELIDSDWVYTTLNPHKTVQYKFLINDNYWCIDSLNPNMIKISKPNDGFNSIVYINN